MLELKKLIMTGFCVFEETKVIEFNSGINILNAFNGVGKTTINNAIELLLIDHHDSFEQYINYNKDSFNLSLDFINDNNNYTISIFCKKGKNGCVTNRKLIHNENEIATDSDVVIKMNEILDSNLVLYGLCLKQNDQDNIISCSDSSRRDLLKKIFEYDFNKQVKEFIEPKIEKLKTDIATIDKEIYKLDNTKYEPKPVKPLPCDEITYNTTKLELDKLKSEIEIYKTKKEIRDSKDQEVKNKSNVIAQKNLQLSLEQTKIQLANNKIEELKNKNISQEYSNKKQILQNELLVYTENKFNSLEQLKSELETKITTEYPIKINELQFQLDQIKLIKIMPYNDTELKLKETNRNIVNTQLVMKQASLNIETNDIRTLIHIILNCKFDLEKLQSDLEVLETGICPVCGSDCNHKVDEYQLKISELQIEINNKNIELENLKLVTEENINKEIVELQSELNNYNIEIEQMNKNKKEIEDAITKNNTDRETKASLTLQLEKMLSEKEATIVEFENKKQSILKDIANKESSIQQSIDSLVLQEKKDIQNIKEQLEKELEGVVEKQEHINNYQHEIDMLTSEMLELQLYVTNFDLELVAIDQTKYDSLQLTITNYDTTIIENAQIVQFNLELEETKKKDLLLLSTKNEEKIKLVSDQYNQQQAKTIMLTEFPNYAIDMGIQDTEDQMNNFIEQVYTKSLNINLRSTKTSIKLEYGTGQRMIDANRLSGAEKKIVQMSFTNIFNRQLDLQCLILDEPDAALDDINKLELYSALLEMKDVYKQMIITTHSEKMKNYLLSNCGEEVSIITL